MEITKKETTVVVKQGWVDISGLLSEQDHTSWWKGIEPDRNDGSDCEITTNVQSIIDAIDEFGMGNVMIWEKGNAYIEGINTSNPESIKVALEEATNTEIELCVE